MTIKLSLLEERVEYLVAEFGNKVTVGKTDDQGFVVLEFNMESEWEVLKLFHAGFQCGYDYKNKHTMHLM